MSSQNHRRFYESPGTACEPPSPSDTHDSRVLDPVAYDKVRAHSPHRNPRGRRRFGTPDDQPNGAKWAIKDRQESLVIWEDDWGRLWEKGSGGPARRSDMVHVPVWWQRAEAYTDAYIKETARYVLYRNLDGNIRIRQSLREGVSASTHCFFGYFPRRGHSDLWFLPKSTPNSSGLRVFSNATTVTESPSHAPRTAADAGTQLEAIRHAVRQGLDSGRDLDIKSCPMEEEIPDRTRPLSEQVQSLLSLIEVARLGFRFVVKEENAETEFNIGEGGAKRASDGFAKLVTTSHEAEVPLRPDRDQNSSHPLANDARHYFKKQLFGERKGNGPLSSTNDDESVSGLHLVRRHHPPEVSVVPDPHPGAEAEVVGNCRSPGAARLGGAGPAPARHAGSLEMARNIHEADRRLELRQQKSPKPGQRRRMYGAQADPQLEQPLRNAGRSQVRRGQMQRRHDEGRSPRRRRIPEHGKQKKFVSAAVQGLPTTPVKGIRGRVRGSHTGRSSHDAGNKPQTWQSEKELSPHQQARASRKKRQEALAALEGRIQTSAETEAKETRVGDRQADFHPIPPSPSLLMVFTHTRGKRTSQGTSF